MSFYDELTVAYKAFTNATINTTSLPFIVTQLPSNSLAEDNEPFEVLIIGGTLGGKAICVKKNKTVSVVKQELDRKIPSIATKEELLNYVALSLEDNINLLAINFAYPLRPIFRKGKLDGELLDIGTTGKAVSAPDLIGTVIGENLETYIQNHYGKSVNVAVGNDSLCLSLAGKGIPNINVNQLGFGIVGTGLNFGFFLTPHAVVNLESHAFEKFQQTELGETLAKKTGSPYGKETNGENLYKHFNYFLEKEGIDYPHLTSTDQLDDLVKMHAPIVTQAAKDTLLRSAQLVACQVAGIMEFKNADMSFVMEGGLFWQGEGYKKSVEETVKLLTKHSATFIKIENSNLYGAAQLVA